LTFRPVSPSSLAGGLCRESGGAEAFREPDRGAPGAVLGAEPESGRRAFGVSAGRGGLWPVLWPSGGATATVRFGAGTIRGAVADAVASRGALSPSARSDGEKSRGARVATTLRSLAAAGGVKVARSALITLVAAGLTWSDPRTGVSSLT
jgi:hypothetical protein